MTKAELIKRFEENRDAAERASHGACGVMSAVCQEEATTWAVAINWAQQLGVMTEVPIPIPISPIASPGRKLSIERDENGSEWAFHIWVKTGASSWHCVYSQPGFKAALDAAICARKWMRDNPA